MAEITKATIDNRRAVLQADADKVAAHLNALHGALQDCDWFLAELEREESKEAEVVDSGN